MNRISAELTSELSNIKLEERKFYTNKLPLLENEIIYFFAKIKECNDLSAASNYFKILGEIQPILSSFLYKYNVQLPQFLRNFAIDFDRFEGINEKLWLFNEIKSNVYPVAQNSDFTNMNSEELKSFLKILEAEQEDFYDRQLPFLQQEVLYYLYKIKSCDDINDATSYLDSLKEIRDALVLLINKYQITVSYRLTKFIKDFNRLDYQSERDYLFNMVKNEGYELEK